MLISTALLDELTAQAKASPRLRMNLDLRNTPADQSQRMLNALEPGTVMPIHRHRHTSETVVVLRGKVKWVYYNDKKEVTATYIVAPGSDLVGLSVPIGQWHSLECLETGTVIINKFYSPLNITAKAEAQHVALLEQKEAKVPYIYVPSAPVQDNQKTAKNKKKK